MTISVYPKTATKAKTKSANVFAFGRDADKAGLPVAQGGYALFKLSENYAAHVRGGIAKSWGLVARDLSYVEVIDLMNKRCHHIAFNFTKVEK